MESMGMGNIIPFPCYFKSHAGQKNVKISTFLIQKNMGVYYLYLRNKIVSVIYSFFFLKAANISEHKTLEDACKHRNEGQR